jgi:hypothetical protein
MSAGEGPVRTQEHDTVVTPNKNFSLTCEHRPPKQRQPEMGEPGRRRRKPKDDGTGQASATPGRRGLPHKAKPPLVEALRRSSGFVPRTGGCTVPPATLAATALARSLRRHESVLRATRELAVSGLDQANRSGSGGRRH